MAKDKGMKFRVLEFSNFVILEGASRQARLHYGITKPWNYQTYPSRLRFSRKIPISLSPRPETLTTIICDFFIRGAALIDSASACADSRAGMIPSVSASRRHALSASVSEADTYSARPVSFNQACSGPMDG